MAAESEGAIDPIHQFVIEPMFHVPDWAACVANVPVPTTVALRAEAVACETGMLEAALIGWVTAELSTFTAPAAETAAH